MIKLPNLHRPFDYENNFYLSCDNSRIGKIIAHYELFKLSSNTPGCIIECGVFKGISLVKFATFLKLLKKSNKKIIAFDAFGKHPTTKISSDHKRRKELLSHGNEAISEKQLLKVLLNLLDKQKNQQRLRENFLSEIKSIRVEGFEESNLNTEQIELIKKVWETVNKMPERRRLVFELHRKHGFSYKEIAKILEITVKTVENHMSQALQYLRENIEINKLK